MRIRTFKPEFFSHPVLARLPEDTQLVALGLLSFADDEGFFRADHHLVHAALRPYREDRERTRKILIELSLSDWCVLKHHSRQGPLGLITTFSRHQRVNRPTPSKLRKYWAEASLSPHAGLTEASPPEQGTGNREQGTKPPPPPPPPPSAREEKQEKEEEEAERQRRLPLVASVPHPDAEAWRALRALATDVGLSWPLSPPRDFGAAWAEMGDCGLPRLAVALRSLVADVAQGRFQRVSHVGWGLFRECYRGHLPALSPPLAVVPANPLEAAFLARCEASYTLRSVCERVRPVRLEGDVLVVEALDRYALEWLGDKALAGVRVEAGPERAAL